MLPKIEHVVVLMMENHSFDDHFGMLGRGDGLTLSRDGQPVNYNPNPTGGFVRSFHNPNTVGYEGNEISQSWNASHISWDHGTNMGFVTACGPASMGYWTGEDLPFYYSLARQFPIGDRYFCSVMAQTYPNRRFLIAGTALGDVSTDATGISTTDAPNGTIFDRLDHYGISWRDYYPDLPTCALFEPIYLDNLHDGKLAPVGQFVTDAASGNLPAFSLVDPYLKYSEEDNDISIGEAYAATIVEAVLGSPKWDSTALIYIYDEHGGWYDHVPPVPAVRPDDVPPEITVPPDQPGAYDYTGFRVPCAVVSPWAKRNHVSHLVYDHTSILKMVETKWNLPAMTYRDANARDLLDFFDFSAKEPPFAEPPRLAAPLNPFTGPLPPTSNSPGFHPVATAVPGAGPAPGALVTTIEPGTNALIARHSKRALR
jgi:phospholipase C